MKVKVIENVCIGCGGCCATAPDIFEMSDNGTAYAKDRIVKDENKEKVMEAKNNCPTNAIDVDEEVVTEVKINN